MVAVTKLTPGAGLLMALFFSAWALGRDLAGRLVAGCGVVTMK
jgi:hypothetical protein